MPGAPADLSSALRDRYHIERELGSGGMATVYLARDLKHDRNVALKVLKPELSASVGADRFLAEIKTTARLHHPHILPLFDSGTSGRFLYYVMPHVDGESLRDRLVRERPLPLAEALQITREVADALAYAHANDVVHRDIKPENILLERGHAVVADFGIARALDAAGSDRITQTGHSLGTPHYMSPEQASGDKELDGRSDLYSLACMTFEMLTGEPPFSGATGQAILMQRFTQPAPHVSSKRKDIPTPVDAALHRAMSRDANDRHATVERFVEMLAAAPTGGSQAASDKSIAVLPFESMSSDPENEFFADGISEDIINALTQVEGLRVAARTSAFSFKGKKEDLRVVGDKLNVATVLEGSVRKSGNRLRITAQLINVADGYHLWSERYDRDLTDIFAVQDEIANAIAAKLQLTLAKPAEDQAARPKTAHMEAYELYLKGRVLCAQRGAAIPKALVCFERAVELDPNYAAAHAGLGEALRLLSQYGHVRPAEAMPRAKAAVARALELDPDLAEAYDTKGLIAISHDFDADAALRAWDRALALNPMLTQARLARALWGLCVLRGDDAGASAEVDLAVANDPLSAVAATFHGFIHGITGRYTLAVAEAKRAVELDPDSFLTQMSLLWAYSWAGETEAAISQSRRALLMSGRSPWALGMMSGVYRTMGDTARSDAVYRELLARSEVDYVQSCWLAFAAAGAGRGDEAIEHALQSVSDREPIGLPFMRWPKMEVLFSHPRYPELRQRIGL